MTSSQVSSGNELVYSKLPPGEHIRVLQLLKPAKGSETVRATLTARPLYEAYQSYNAVSYAWGDATHTRTILINDREFRVGENIWQFLSHVQHHVKSFPVMRFWIDAVCINQSDADEKNVQVQLMGKVYEGAEYVFVWLGCGSSEVEMLFRCLSYANKQRRKHVPQPVDLSTMFSVKSRLLNRNRMASKVRELKATLGPALISLFANDYWKRTWIVQECILAPEGSIFVFCGQQFMTLDGLKSFEGLELDVDLDPGESGFEEHPAVQEWKRFTDLSSRGIRSSRSYNPGKIMFGYADWYEELFTLLQHVQSAKCSVPHDKVFGILSLVQHDPRHEDIHVDYGMSLEELFFRSLACWTTARLTVKLARQLMLNLNVDLVKIRGEAQRYQLLGDSMNMFTRVQIPPVDFLMIRLGTVTQIQTEPTSSVVLGTHSSISLRFDGLYSTQLDFLDPNWLSTGLATRCDSAVGFSLCLLELGDVIFAFVDSMACPVFRKSDQRLTIIGWTILASETNDDVEVLNDAIKTSNGMMQNELQSDAFGHIEIDSHVLEHELGLSPVAAAAVISCHSGGKYDWPPLRCVESQRHLRLRY